MIITPNEKIVLASGNQSDSPISLQTLPKNFIITQSQFDVPEVEETGTTFVENAIIKARNAALHCNMPAIADDSGLVVDPLDGAPGVISARYAGKGASDQENLQKVLFDLEGVPDTERSARFICVMVFLHHAEDPCPIIAQGLWEGRILRHSVGNNGFGYDPIFWIPDQNCTSAELSANTKNRLSHRGQALQQLITLIN